MTDRPLRIEALYRLEAMAVESETWDLSDNDRAAIRRVLDDLAAAGSERDSALRERDEARAAKDGAYRERDQVVALAARMAAVLHWPTWLGRHEDKPGDLPWEDDWRNIVFIDLPSGQVSWHIHDSELPLVRFLPSDLSSVAAPWDGHDTAEKYRRCDAPWPIRDLHSDLSAARADTAAADRERDEAREALREVQWGGEWSRGIGEEVEQTCPGCGRRRSVGHAEACIVARALASRGDEGRQG